jgi:hypothetical protein
MRCYDAPALSFGASGRGSLAVEQLVNSREHSVEIRRHALEVGLQVSQKVRQ